MVLRWLCDSPRTGCAWRIIPLCMWREQAIIEWSRRVISIVGCCHCVKLCAHATRDFLSQQLQSSSFYQVDFKHEQPQVLSPDLHVAIGTIHQTQEAANVLWAYRHNSQGCQMVTNLAYIAKKHYFRKNVPTFLEIFLMPNFCFIYQLPVLAKQSIHIVTKLQTENTV